jgi:hypothetical protein
MSTTGIDLSSLLAQLQLNDEQKQLKAVPRYSFDSQSSPTYSPQYLQTTADLFLDRRAPLSSTVSLPASLTPAAALLANFDPSQLYGEQQFSDDDDTGRPTKTTDRRTASLGDALAPLGLSRQNSQQQQQSATRYKTELCRPFEEHGTCRYGNKCQFAHGRAELRVVSRHPKYKTDLCRTFHSTGLCPYGRRCHFVHNEEERGMEILPADHHHQQGDAQAIVQQTQLLQRRLSAVAAETADVAARRRAMQHQFSQQQSVFESDGADDARCVSMPQPTQWDVLPPTSAAQHQPLARRISVADPLHHIQQLQPQTTRTNRLQSLGLVSPPGFESIPAAYSSLPLTTLGAPAPRSIGSAAESMSSTASSVDGGSRSTSPTLGLCALPETQIWQQQPQQPGWTTSTVNAAAPVPPAAAVPAPPTADALQEVWARLLSHLPAEKIVEMILATMKQQQSPAVSSPELSPPTTSSGSPWPQLPLFPPLSSTAASNAAVW